jgi:hypothetical protein
VHTRYNSLMSRAPYILWIGMWAIETEAARGAIGQARRSWLPVLEAYAEEHERDLGPDTRRRLNRESNGCDVARKCRCWTREPKPLTAAAGKTRDRVRHYRQRRARL